jgi:acyl-CoA oxidase
MSWESVAGMSECRRACGGLGYSHYAGIGRYWQSLDVYQTWEGDNNILQQQTSKFLLDLLKKKMKGKLEKKTITCEWVTVEPVLGMKCSAETFEDLFSFSSLLQIFEFRANFLL